MERDRTGRQAVGPDTYADAVAGEIIGLDDVVSDRHAEDVLQFDAAAGRKDVVMKDLGAPYLVQHDRCFHAEE